MDWVMASASIFFTLAIELSNGCGLGRFGACGSAWAWVGLQVSYTCGLGARGLAGYGRRSSASISSISRINSTPVRSSKRTGRPLLAYE